MAADPVYSPLYSRLLCLHDVPAHLRSSERLLEHLQGALTASAGLKVLRWHAESTAILYVPSTAVVAEALGSLDGVTRLSEAFRHAHEASHPLGALPTGGSSGGPRPATDASVAGRLIRGALGPQRNKMGAAARTDPASTGSGYLRPNAPLPPLGGSGAGSSGSGGGGGSRSDTSSWRAGPAAAAPAAGSEGRGEEPGEGEEGEGAAAAAAAAGAGAAVRGRGEPLWGRAGAAGSSSSSAGAQLAGPAQQQQQQHRLVERGSGVSMASTLKSLAMGWGPQAGAGAAAPQPARGGGALAGGDSASSRASKALAAAAAAAAAAEAARGGARVAQQLPPQQPPPQKPVLGSLSSLEEDESRGSFAWADRADEEDAQVLQARQGSAAPAAAPAAPASGKPRRPLVVGPTIKEFVPTSAAKPSAPVFVKNPEAKEFVPSWGGAGAGAAEAALALAGGVVGGGGALGALLPPHLYQQHQYQYQQQVLLPPQALQHPYPQPMAPMQQPLLQQRQYYLPQALPQGAPPRY